MTLLDIPTPTRIRTATSSERAYLLLKTVFTVAPILFGLDKFFNELTSWPHYLTPWINNIVPGSAQDAMHLVGAIEIVAGILVAIAPRWGAYVVALWLVGIIVDLVSYSAGYEGAPRFYDIALRDFGLFVAALALAQLAQAHAKRGQS